MKTSALLILSIVIFTGCVGGPARDYYNPVTVGAKFKPPITSARVANVNEEQAKLVREGYTVIGFTIYGGKYPEAVELQAQAKRVGANHIIYSSSFVPNAPGSWSFGFNRYGGGGGSGGGHDDVHIVFLGK